MILPAYFLEEYTNLPHHYYHYLKSGSWLPFIFNFLRCTFQKLKNAQADKNAVVKYRIILWTESNWEWHIGMPRGFVFWFLVFGFFSLPSRHTHKRPWHPWGWVTISQHSSLLLLQRTHLLWLYGGGNPLGMPPQTPPFAGWTADSEQLILLCKADTSVFCSVSRGVLIALWRPS